MKLVNLRTRILFLPLLCWSLLSLAAADANQPLSDEQHSESIIEITDSHGKYRFASPPKRFVSLNWALTEQLLDLGEMPLGIADLSDFTRLSTTYEVGPSVIDLGPRLSPNLEKIRNLEPDVIFIGYSQRSLLRPLSNIATVIYFNNFSRRYNNAAKADERLIELAKLFLKSSAANTLIIDRDRELAAINKTIEASFISSANTRSVKPRFVLFAQGDNSDSDLAVFGDNSMPSAAMKSIGLNIISPPEVDKYGVTNLSSTEFERFLQNQKNESLGMSKICLINFYKYSKRNAEQRESAQCQYNIDYQQAFGGAMSVKWLAETVWASIGSDQ